MRLQFANFSLPKLAAQCELVSRSLIIGVLTCLSVPSFSLAESLLMTGTMTAHITAEGTLGWSLAGGDLVGSGRNSATVNFFGERGELPFSFSAMTGHFSDYLQFTAGERHYAWGAFDPIPAPLKCFASCSFNFTVNGDPIILPATYDGHLNMSTPVAMSGLLRLCDTPTVCQVNTSVHGQGIVNMRFYSFESDRWFMEEGRVTLTAPVIGGGDGGQAPIPEPATLLLFGSGLAGLASKRRMRSA